MCHYLYSLLMGYEDEYKTRNQPARELCFGSKDRNIKKKKIITSQSDKGNRNTNVVCLISMSIPTL